MGKVLSKDWHILLSELKKIFILFFLRQGLTSLGYPGGQYVDQADLELIKIHLLQPSVGTKVCATTHDLAVKTVCPEIRPLH